MLHNIYAGHLEEQTINKDKSECVNVFHIEEDIEPTIKMRVEFKFPSISGKVSRKEFVIDGVVHKLAAADFTQSYLLPQDQDVKVHMIHYDHNDEAFESFTLAFNTSRYGVAVASAIGFELCGLTRTKGK